MDSIGIELGGCNNEVAALQSDGYTGVHVLYVPL